MANEVYANGRELSCKSASGEIDSVVPRRLLHAASGTTDAVGRAGPLP